MLTYTLLAPLYSTHAAATRLASPALQATGGYIFYSSLVVNLLLFFLAHNHLHWK